MLQTINGMTKEEIRSWLERVKNGTEFPEVKKFVEKQLQLYTNDCPSCGAYIYGDDVDILYIRERGTYHFVTYVCRICNTGFRKIEILEDGE